MNVKALLLAAAVATVTAVASAAAAGGTCYRVDFDDEPRAEVTKSNPPQVYIGTGNPHVESYPC